MAYNISSLTRSEDASFITEKRPDVKLSLAFRLSIGSIRFKTLLKISSVTSGASAV